MTMTRDPEAAVRDAYQEETEPKQRARELASASIGPVFASSVAAHRSRPYTVIVTRGHLTAHHRFGQPEQADEFRRLLMARRTAERELALDQRDDEVHE